MKRTPLLLAVAAAAIAAAVLFCPGSRDREGAVAGAGGVEETRPDPSDLAPITARTPVGADGETARPIPERPAEEEERPVRAGTGSLRVSLRTHEGAPVLSGTVRLASGTKGRDETARRQVDARGRVLFQDLDPGPHVVRVVAESLPDGLMPAWGGDSVVFDHGGMPGFGGSRVEVRLGETVDVVLALARTSTIFGYVLEADGSPIEGTRVRASCMSFSSVSKDGITDASGYYECTDIHPARYRVVADFGLESPHAEASQPRPAEVEVVSGSTSRVDIVTGDGPVTIVGRVVDQEGEPFPDLWVQCYYHLFQDELDAGWQQYDWGARCTRARTDENGEYRLEGVYAEGVGVQVAVAGYMPSAGMGESVLGAFVPGFYRDMRGKSGELDVGTSVAVRSHPFLMRGTVKLDPRARKPGRWRRFRDASQLKMTVYLDHSPEPPVRRPRQKTVNIEKDGSFEWWCHAGVFNDAVVKVHYPGGESVELPIRTIPNGKLEGVEIRYPR